MFASGREAFNWWLVAVTAALCMLGTICIPGGFGFTGHVIPLLSAAGLAAIGLYYRYRRRNDVFAATLLALSQIVAFTIFGAALSYMAAICGDVLWDDTFVRWDRAVGFDWVSYRNWVESSSFVSGLLSLGYQSIKVQMVVVIAYFGLSGSTAIVQRFVFAVVVAGLVSIVISALMPAFTMYNYVGGPIDSFAPAVGYSYVETLTGLRDGTLRSMNVTAAEGIIAFPSYHAALAVIFGWALWHDRFLRWPGLERDEFMFGRIQL